MAFSGKVVIITGASSGIGAELALILAKENAKLSLVGRNADKFKKLIANIKKTGTKNEPHIILANIDTEAKRIVSETVNKFDRIDVLVNCAGFSIHASLEKLCIENYDKMMTTNVRAAIQISQLAVPYLLKSKGNILNISSVASLRPFPENVGYCVSKSAMDQFTRCTAIDLSPKGVRVNTICPGFIDNDFHRTAGCPEDKYEELRDKFGKCHPIGRAGTSKEVANVAAFIINNDLASFVTGVCLPVDGGLAIAPIQP